MRAFGSFLRLLASDVRFGMRCVLPRLGVVVAICALVFFLAWVTVLFKLPETGGRLTFGENLLCMWRGTLPHNPGLNELFKFPMAWFALLVPMAYVSLDYPFRDLGGMGLRLIVAARSRWAWWGAKCVWTVLCAVVCWSVPFVLSALVTLAQGGEWTPSARPGVAYVLGAGRNNEIAQIAQTLSSEGGGAEAVSSLATLDVMPAVLAMAVVLAAILLVQMVVSLMVHPVVGMVASVSILFLSAFFRNHLLLGSYLMLVRAAGFMREGMEPVTGTLLALGAGLAAALLGGFVFTRRDLLGKEVSAS